MVLRVGRRPQAYTPVTGERGLNLARDDGDVTQRSHR